MSGRVIRQKEETHEGYTFSLKLERHWNQKTVSVLSVEAKAPGGDETIGYLDGYLLKRPKRNFHSTADAISGELQRLAVNFCEPNGVASRIDHPKLVGSSAVESGGFFNIEKVEVKGSHQGKALGLYMIHYALDFLDKDWSLAVMQPDTLNKSACKWPDDNDRVQFSSTSASRNPTPEQKELMKIGADKTTRHFARMGFAQAGRKSSTYDSFFLTKDSYFPPGKTHASAIDRWLTKEEAQAMDIFTPAERQDPKGLDKELANLFTSSMMPPSFGDVQDLVSRGASIDNANAMHHAAASEAKVTILAALIGMGGNVNAPDDAGTRPLHVAAVAKNPRAATLLMDAGADSTLKNDDGDTPLMSLNNTIKEENDFARAFGLGGSPMMLQSNAQVAQLKSILSQKRKPTTESGGHVDKKRKADKA